MIRWPRARGVSVDEAAAVPGRSGRSRVVVVGTSCAGKTTLGGRLGKVLGVPHVQLDALFWGPNWSVRPEFEEEVDAALAHDGRVFDGT